MDSYVINNSYLRCEHISHRDDKYYKHYRISYCYVTWFLVLKPFMSTTLISMIPVFTHENIDLNICNCLFIVM